MKVDSSKPEVGTPVAIKKIINEHLRDPIWEDFKSTPNKK